jgi:magnesium chelatase subunit H
LYKQLAQLRVEIANNATVETVTAMLPELPQTAGESPVAYMARVTRYLDDLEQRLILDGLHVLGAHMSLRPCPSLARIDAGCCRNGNPGLMQHILEAGIDTAVGTCGAGGVCGAGGAGA